MPILKNIDMPKTKVMPNQATDHMGYHSSEGLTIHLRSSFDHPSSMKEGLKQANRAKSDQLINMFNDTLKEKGEFQSSNIHQLSNDEVEVEGLSNLTLHSFILKAEELGKKVTYSKTLTVKVSD